MHAHMHTSPQAKKLDMLAALLSYRLTVPASLDDLRECVGWLEYGCQ